MPTNPTAAHTPTPWDYFVGHSNGCGLIRIESAHDAVPAGLHVCSLTREHEQDAAFIVTACNAHAGLVAALKRTRKELRELRQQHEGAWNDTEIESVEEADDIATAALRQAGEGEAS